MKTNCILMPIHITHSADIDGVGCALLDIVFDHHMWTYTHIDENDVCIYSESSIIIPVGNGKEKYAKGLKSFTENISENMKRFGPIEEHKIVDGIYYPVRNIFYPILIITDVERFPEFEDELFKSIYDELKNISEKAVIAPLRVWNFDHHESNQDFGLPMFMSSSDDENYPSDIPYIYSTTFVNNTTVDADPFKWIPCLNGYTYEDDIHAFAKKLLDENGLNQELPAERSATYLYFKFLLESGILIPLHTVGNHNFHNGYKGILLENLVKVVYHISNYDTFEFAKDNGCIPIEYKYPDTLSVLFNSYNKDFFKVLGILKDAVKRIPFGEDDDYDDEESSFTKECYLPELDDVSIVKIKDFRINREFRYDKFLNSSKRMTLGEFFDTIDEYTNNQIENLKLVKEQISLSNHNDKCILFNVTEIDDISYIANKILAEDSTVNYILNFYPQSRIVSTRSYNNDEDKVNCASISKIFGGGGHICAAGFNVGIEIGLAIMKLYWKN